MSASFSDRFRYRLDNLFARGPIALIGLLALLSLAIILLATVVVTISGVAQGRNFPGLLYWSLLYALDTGTVANDAGNGWFQFWMLFVTIGGIFIVSALIGVITTGMDTKMDQLRRGRSVVLETGHSLILGWSPQIFSIISELVIANENQRRPCIVVLGDQDKVDMEEEIRARVPNTRNTRVVCRSGNPLDPADLRIGNPRMARSIIVLAPESDDPDTQVIKTILALTNAPDRPDRPYHIVAEIRDPKNLEVARLVARDEAQLILADDLIARITVQTCRQSGLSVVYNELLDFDGDEIYFQDEPALVGKPFGEALFAYEDSSVIGLQRADGTTLLNPAMDRIIEPGEKIIAVSRDDDTIKISGVTTPALDANAIQPPVDGAATAERTLILGWNPFSKNVLDELDNYVAPGSTTTVVADEAEVEAEVTELRPRLRNQAVSVRNGDTTDRQVLEALDIPSYQHVIVLSYMNGLDPQQSDARTLITLLHLRDMQEKRGGSYSITSEMRDLRNRELARVTRADDFIVSDQLVSLMMAQISENKYLSGVFEDLFDAAGSEIYLKPAESYVRLDSPVSFYTVLEAARRRGEIALGYKTLNGSNGNGLANGVVVNPKKSDPVAFAPGDRIIVLAEG